MALMETIARLFRRETKKLDKRLQEVDPAGDAELDLGDTKAEADDFEAQIAEVMATTKGLRTKADEDDKQVQKYEGLAKQAANAKNRDDVTKFVTEQSKFEQLAATGRTQITKNEQLIAKLRNQLAACRGRISQAEVNQASLAARHTATKLRASMQAKAGVFGTSTAFERLTAFEKRVEHDENVADAQEELGGSSVTEAEARYEVPEVVSRVDALMAASASVSA